MGLTTPKADMICGSVASTALPTAVSMAVVIVVFLLLQRERGVSMCTNMANNTARAKNTGMPTPCQQTLLRRGA